MTLDLNAGKLLGFFALIWPLLIIALLVNPAAWSAWQVAAFFALPLVCTALLWALARRRWRLEVTPDALVHHTLGRTERFDWRAIGGFEVRSLLLPHMIGPRTLRFAYPATADSSGPPRTLMLVFGDQSPVETAITLERFRQLYAQAPQKPQPADATLRLRMGWMRMIRLFFPLFFLLGAGLALAAPYATKLEMMAVVAGVVAILALLASGRRLTLDTDYLVLERWGRRTEISWFAIEDATLPTLGVWPFRLPVLTLTWRGDHLPLKVTRIGDLYGDRRLEDLAALIEARRTQAQLDFEFRSE